MVELGPTETGGESDMRSAIAMVLLLSAGVAQADATAQKVLDCVRGNSPASVRVQDFELQVTEADGESRTLAGRLYAQREASGKNAGKMHAMLRVDQPDNLKGASYLVRETDDYLRDGMFVYLPSVKRVRRVSGTFADGALLGTSFSYYDFKQITGAFGDLKAELEAATEIGQRPVHVLRFTALPGAETAYSAVRAWIDQKTCLPLQAEFYVGDQVRKRMTAKPEAIRTDGDHRYVSELEMRDLSDGLLTRLRILKVSLGKEVPGRYFDPNAFHF